MWGLTLDSSIMKQLRGHQIFFLFLLSSVFGVHECITRTYYIGINEEIWDYAPSGKNLISGRKIGEDEHASIFLQQGPHSIGSKYKKAVYREYTDGHFTTEIPKPAWLGFLGPILKAEVEDVIVVHLKNFASRPYSLHPHGVFYEKDSEGALYPDGTSGKQKKDDGVPPGGSYTYTWIVKPQYAPTEADANCLTWIYHSHTDSPKDIVSGLIGALLTCKKGTLLQNSNVRRDVDQDFIAMFNVVDENLSWYLDDNINTYCTEPSTVDPENEEFQESNKMHVINGYLFGNLPSFEMCVNRTVAWHLFGMGNEVDIHSAYFHGHTVLDRGHRADVISLFPATFVTLEMIPRNVGKWMLSCQVNDHIQAGMQAFYEVSSCGQGSSKSPPSGKTRKYYIAAEEQLWNYAPSGYNVFDGVALNASGSDSETFFGTSQGRLGGQYLKVRYVEYTDETFTTKKKPSGSETHLGILGPVIKAEVDDTILVTFMNNASRNYSIQPHGVLYSKENEGAIYNDGIQKPGSQVQPHEVFTYRWAVTEGPSSSDPACISYLYYSSSSPVHDTNSGLMGPLLVCRKNTLNEKGLQQEFFLLFTVFDENLSWYLENNIQRFGTQFTDKEDKDFQESNKMHAVNGYMYGNLPGLEMCEGDKVSWHMLGLGTEVDVHGVYFQGNTFVRQGTNRDTLSLFPHTAVTVTMETNTNGTFEVNCRTTDHYMAGMRQLYSVKKCEDRNSPDPLPVTTRAVYFIAAEEVEWDYSPDRSWELEKHNASKNESYGNIFVGQGEDRIGSKYKKVVYREYTDITFTQQKKRPPQEQHLEILGPVIRAEVGEEVVVHFKNKASRPFSIHAHGVQQVAPVVPVAEPGKLVGYQWEVLERSGPGTSDPNCISYAYYSSVDYLKDIYSGLIGPLIICRKGILNKMRKRTDVDREFALLFMVFDENNSGYLDDNIRTYLHKEPEDIERNEDFLKSNKMHAINGKLYGNLHGLTMTEGEKTDWYLLGMGNEVDIHTVHFHAQSFIYKTERSHRGDVYDLFPGTFQTVELLADNPGTWLLHCHVINHIHAGMETTFTIFSRKGDFTTPEETMNTIPNAAHSLKITFCGKELEDTEGNVRMMTLFGLGLLHSVLF
uniref:ferroxidase n=1 Tax=Lepisosteus oculatus TaxID=7918 RepID=W5ML02_LEPOC|nr:PREDICTED: hephaestin-like protein 1 [Lepisosteus oculatus]